MAGRHVVDMTQIAVAATAVSGRRTVMVEVSADGYVVGVRLLSDVVRRWDSQMLEDRVKLVAAVAHDRYLAGLQAGDVSLSDHGVGRRGRTRTRLLGGGSMGRHDAATGRPSASPPQSRARTGPGVAVVR